MNQVTEALFESWSRDEGPRSPPDCKNNGSRTWGLQFDLWPFNS